MVYYERMEEELEKMENKFIFYLSEKSTAELI